MNQVVAFPDDSSQRSLSEQRFWHLHQMVAQIDQCRENMTFQEKEASYFSKLEKTCGHIHDAGINISSFGRLTAASENWLRHYASHETKPASQRARLGQAQQQLRELSRTMKFGRIATHADIIAYQREIELGELNIVK